MQQQIDWSVWPISMLSLQDQLPELQSLCEGAYGSFSLYACWTALPVCARGAQRTRSTTGDARCPANAIHMHAVGQIQISPWVVSDRCKPARSRQSLEENANSAMVDHTMYHTSRYRCNAAYSLAISWRLSPEGPQDQFGGDVRTGNNGDAHSGARRGSLWTHTRSTCSQRLTSGELLLPGSGRLQLCQNGQRPFKEDRPRLAWSSLDSLLGDSPEYADDTHLE